MSQEEVVELGVAGLGPEDVPCRPHGAASVIRLGSTTTFVELKNTAPGAPYADAGGGPRGPPPPREGGGGCVFLFRRTAPPVPTVPLGTQHIAKPPTEKTD